MLFRSTVSHAELVHELNHSGEGAPKFVELAMARQRAEAWRALGLRVGFTNGCFDLLHPGHVALLREARRKCDRLVVGLNTDASVRGLKGPSRPVQSEEARGQVLAALSDVNLVTLFDEPTPEQLIRELRPDVLVKGADYKPEEVVGADLVKGWGGELVLVELVPGQSTTRIIGASKS